MSRVIVGFGNDLRGEDGFGIEVIKQLEKLPLKNTKLLSLFQLTPELCLELINFEEIIFIDAGYSEKYHYNLACNLEESNPNTLSHHVSIKTILTLLNTLYKTFPRYMVFSMLTNSFDKVKNSSKYYQNIELVTKYIEKL